MSMTLSAKGRRLALAMALLLAALAFGLWRSGLAPRALWWTEAAFSAARSFVFGSTPRPLRPLEDPADIAMLERSATETPDPFGTLAQALAALDEHDRHLILLKKSANARKLTARAWGMENAEITGDPGQIEPFLEMLERPFNPPPMEVYLSTPEATARWSSFVGLIRALLSGAEYESSVYVRMRDAAMAHIEHEWHWKGAALVLALLDERGKLDDGAKAALERATEHPVREKSLSESLARLKAD